MMSTGAKRVAIVGAGPAGSALATFCARSGHHVTLFDSAPPHGVIVGESLLPFGNRVLLKLGITMDGFVEKYGAVFVRNGQRVRYSFEDAERPLYRSAHQVRRAEFDARLRRQAIISGARLVLREIDEPPKGYDWIVDATGRRRVLGRSWTSYSGHACLRNAGRVRHYPSLITPPGSEPGDITIYALCRGWFWVIPLQSERTSVGLVTTPERKGLGWEAALLECPELAELLSHAGDPSPVTGHRDFTEYADAFSGDGWALVGDAALFLDPVFSSGILFALEGAERLARVIDGTLAPVAYETEMRAAAQLIEPLILGFYSGDFFDLSWVDGPQQKPRLRAGIVSLLAGDIFDDAPRMARVVARRLPELALHARRERAETKKVGKIP